MRRLVLHPSIRWLARSIDHCPTPYQAHWTFPANPTSVGPESSSQSPSDSFQRQSHPYSTSNHLSYLSIPKRTRCPSIRRLSTCQSPIYKMAATAPAQPAYSFPVNRLKMEQVFEYRDIICKQMLIALIE